MSYSTKKYLSFDRTEQRDLGITILVLAFILSFTSWGVETFDAQIGLRQLILTILLVGVSLTAKLVTQKWLGIRVGIHAEYKAWFTGLALGVFFIFMTNGRFFFLMIGGIMYGTIERLRIGRQYEISNKALSWISFVGILSHIILAGLAKIFLGFGIFPEAVLRNFMGMNLWFALFSVLPIPLIHSFHKISANDGLTILYSSRMAYVATVLITALSIGLIPFTSLLVGVFVTAAVTAMLWLGYYFYVENK
ncbi:MAG TPA: hypothetical protein VKE88_01065 [Candidatus Nanoarchaeia archaeon]|nr:hypothetical protein [Candidatus Nanoarchaeia archaeon]